MLNLINKEAGVNIYENYLNKFTKEKMIEQFFIFFINSDVNNQVIQNKISSLDNFFIPRQLVNGFFEIKEQLMSPMEKLDYNKLILKRIYLFDFLKKRTSKEKLISNMIDLEELGLFKIDEMMQTEHTPEEVTIFKKAYQGIIYLKRDEEKILELFPELKFEECGCDGVYLFNKYSFEISEPRIEKLFYYLSEKYKDFLLERKEIEISNEIKFTINGCDCVVTKIK